VVAIGYYGEVCKAQRRKDFYFFFFHSTFDVGRSMFDVHSNPISSILAPLRLCVSQTLILKPLIPLRSQNKY
ncbi:MAG: hypothetical protein ABIC39_04060, partial [Pseudomonadota bacterium]